MPMNSPALTPEDRVLILGGSGFVQNTSGAAPRSRRFSPYKYIPIAKTTFAEAVRIAHTEEKTPGIKGF